MANSISGNSSLSTFNATTSNPKVLASQKARLNEQLSIKKKELSETKGDLEKVKLERRIASLKTKIAEIEKTENTAVNKQIR